MHQPSLPSVPRQKLRFPVTAVALCCAGALAGLTLSGCGGNNSAASTDSSNTSSTTTTSTTSGHTGSCGLTTAYYALSSGSVSLASPDISVSTADESAVCAQNSGTSITLTDPDIVTSGSTSSTDNSSFEGQNAAVLAYGSSSSTATGGTVTITGGTISTSGVGANGVFAAGDGATINISDTTITATGDNAHGLDAAAQGTLVINDVIATTSGQSGSVIATDRLGGTVTVNGGTYSASGYRSAGIYSTGVITVTGGTFSATDAEAVVVEGANSVTLSYSVLSNSGGDLRGIFLYNSTSGDAAVGTGTFTMTGGSIKYGNTTGSCFAVANQTGIINLTGTTLTNASANLLTAAAISGWGTTGSNGGIATLNANNTALTGNVVVDSISTAALVLNNGSSLNGAINNADTGESVALTLDSSSTWTVTANSYLTTLSDSAGITGTTVSNIVGNGYTVYYQSSSNSALGGLTYTLSGGGYLKPY